MSTNFALDPQGNAPQAPASGFVAFSNLIGGRPLLSLINSAGEISDLQPFTGRRAVGRETAVANSVTPNTDGLPAGVSQGTVTARLPAAGSLLAASRRVGFVSAAGAGSTAGRRNQTANYMHRGTVLGTGGFYLVYRFALTDAVLVLTANTFVGVINAAIVTDVGPSTLNNAIGIGCDANDTGFSLYSGNGGGVTKTPLIIQSGLNIGTQFQNGFVNTDVFEFALYVAPPSAGLSVGNTGGNALWQFSRLPNGDAGQSASGIILGATAGGALLPPANTMLANNLFRSNGGAASAVGIDLLSYYWESGI